MNPITHLLTSWAAAESSTLRAKDRALVAWVGLSPDLDGLGVIVDAGAQLLGYPNPGLYAQYHHSLLHGLFGAVIISALAAIAAERRYLTFIWCLLAYHLHLLCDLVGSRGAMPDDIWPIHYLEPLSSSLTLSWSGQWPLNAWQNVFITVALLTVAFSRTITHGHSPLAIFNAHAHRVFVETVQARWSQLTKRGK